MFLHYPNQYICLTFHNKISNEINLSKNFNIKTTKSNYFILPYINKLL